MLSLHKEVIEIVLRRSFVRRGYNQDLFSSTSARYRTAASVIVVELVLVLVAVVLLVVVVALRLVCTGYNTAAEGVSQYSAGPAAALRLSSGSELCNAAFNQVSVHE